MILHHGADASGLALWTHWISEPSTAIAMASVTGVYAWGVRRARQRSSRANAFAAWRVRCFAWSIVVLSIAMLSPVDALADELFTAHMAQHVLLAVVAPPLFVAGAPIVAMLWALPLSARRRVVQVVKGARWLTTTWRFMTTPFVSFATHAVVLWAWHMPPLFTAALRHSSLHALEHVSFLGSACLIWWGITYPSRSRRAAYALGIVVLFATMMQSGALGALITFSRRLWFPLQETAAATWGLSPIEDQQLAGLVMWVVGGLLFIVQMSVLFFLWMRHAERRRVAIAAATVATIGLGACRRSHESVVAGGSVDRGRQSLAAMGCGSCHTIAGVDGANGKVGPPLTGIASRSIIAGQLANTPDNMIRWIVDPPAIEPRTAMPNLHVSEASARDIAAYLYTLR